jgi:hypothetical protein
MWDCLIGFVIEQIVDVDVDRRPRGPRWDRARRRFAAGLPVRIRCTGRVAGGRWRREPLRVADGEIRWRGESLRGATPVRARVTGRRVVLGYATRQGTVELKIKQRHLPIVGRLLRLPPY